MKPGVLLVSESGIASSKDIKSLPKNVDAILVGTSLVKAKDPVKKIRSLIGGPVPLLRICGIQTPEEALHCQRLGVDLIGLNFGAE